MFSRKVCHVFVRPKHKVLEVCVFLSRAVSGPMVRRADRRSTTKVANVIHVAHRDQVEPPLTDWFREAYGLQERLAEKARTPAGGRQLRRAPVSRPSRRHR